MNNSFYDVVVIGGGVIGTSIARYLSRFELKGLLIEKHSDVGEETSSANSAIVHSGYDPKPGTLKAKFNVLGNRMMPKVCEELNVSFIKNGSITVGFNDEDYETLQNLLKRAEINGVKAKFLDYEEIHKLEPNLTNKVKFGILCEDSGIISPFGLTVAFMENAMDNGFELMLDTEVVDIKKNNEFYEVYIKNSGTKILTKAVVNAAGYHADEILKMVEDIKYKINPRKGEYVVLDHFNDNFLKHTIFMCPTKVGKGVLVSPTTSFNYIVGPSNDLCEKDDFSTDSLTIDSIKETANRIVKNIPYQETIRTFSGIRANPENDDFTIEESEKNSLFFNVYGIMSPGLASSPAIGEYVSDLIKERLNLKENKNFNPNRRAYPSLKKLGKEKYNELIKENPSFGRIVCRCEKVSEGEIIDSIHRNCGARTVKGVKRRIRPGFGKCQGSFCQEEVIKILARELNIDPSEVRYKDIGSEVLKYTSKGDK